MKRRNQLHHLRICTEFTKRIITPFILFGLAEENRPNLFKLQINSFVKIIVITREHSLSFIYSFKLILNLSEGSKTFELPLIYVKTCNQRGLQRKGMFFTRATKFSLRLRIHRRLSTFG